MKKALLAASIGCTVFAGQANARPPLNYDLVQINGDTKTNTNVYAGLNWQIGGSFVPDIVVGVFNTRVKSNGDVSGANLSAQFDIKNGYQAPKVKLDYLNGQSDIQGTVGAGWDFKKSAPFIGVGVNAPYVNGGVNYSLDGKLDPFFGIHTQGKFKKNSDSTQCQNVGSGNGQYLNSNCLNEI